MQFTFFFCELDACFSHHDSEKRNVEFLSPSRWLKNRHQQQSCVFFCQGVFFCWNKNGSTLPAFKPWTLSCVSTVNVPGWYEEPKRFTTSPTTRSLNLVEMRLLGPTATANNKTKEFSPKNGGENCKGIPSQNNPENMQIFSELYWFAQEVLCFRAKWGSYEILSRSFLKRDLWWMWIFDMRYIFFCRFVIILMWIWEKNQGH